MSDGRSDPKSIVLSQSIKIRSLYHPSERMTAWQKINQQKTYDAEKLTTPTE